MTVESNIIYAIAIAIAIATHSDWLKRLMPVFQPMRSKTNRTTYTWFSPRFELVADWFKGCLFLL